MMKWVGFKSVPHATRVVAPRIEVLEERRLLSSATAPGVPSIVQMPRSAHAEAAQPSVNSTTPADGALNVDPRVYVVAYVNLPNVGGVTDDPATLAANVRLVRTGDVGAAPIPSKVNTTGGGDAIILTPLEPLAARTEYTFEVLAGLTDDTGAAFVPFEMSFTTGDADDAGPDPSIRFDQIPLPSAAGRRFTGITIGPDNKLYAGTMDGEIARFDITADGTLGAATIIRTIRDNNDGDPRIITGLRFDPASTSSNLVLWVSHGDGAETNAPDWSGKISRLSGSSLVTYQDYVVNLPRSVRDHLTQQMDFEPGTAMLFVSQGSSNSMGAPDNAWGLRPERLLSAAILRVDTAAIAERIVAGDGPLDVKTEDVDDDQEPYDPFAPDAPVTLYATGVRNSFDVVWHSNGNLYAPTNGSAPGGNTPAGDGVEALRNVRQNQPDLLFNVHEGKYYGHPNPLRDEFVLNGGNPTSGEDPFEVDAYDVGTDPDDDWEPAVFNFGDNRSPNGVIEYKSNAFSGKLKGALIVAEYSGGDDLIVLKPDATGSIPTGGVQRDLEGMTGFIDPLDLVEHMGSGNLYVVEYGARRITLLRPATIAAQEPRNVGRAVFNDPRGGGTSPVRKVLPKNPNAVPVSVTSVTITGDDAGMFRIVSSPAVPATLLAGQRLEVQVVFDPPTGTSLGIKTAGLRLTLSDTTLSPLELSLRGLATAGEGGANEPSLQRVFDLFELPLEAGDADPFTAEMVLPLATPNDAIPGIKALKKAGSGPVRLEIMDVFASPGSPTIRFGYYNPLTRAQTDVLSVNDSQRTVPPVSIGSLSFDPGGLVFGLYTFAGAFGTTAYTEPDRNTFEPDPALREKVLFYPLLDIEGETVADAYVVAFEEVPGSADYQDFVAVIRNVRASDIPPPAPELTVLVDGVSVDSGATISFPEVDQNATRPERTLALRNDGNVDLAIGAITLPAGFELVEGLSTAALAPGATGTIRVALSTITAGAFDGQASLSSSDADEGTFALRLTGSVKAPPVTDPRPGPGPGPGDPGPGDPGPGDPDPGDPVDPVEPILTAGVIGGLPPIVIAGTKSARGRISVIVRNNNAVGFAGPVTISVAAAGATDPAREGTSAAAESGDALVLATSTKVFKLKPSTQKVVKFKLSVPASVPEGDKALMVSVSTTDGGTANVQGQPFRVAAPVVNLVGTPAPAGTVLRFGKAGSVKVSLRNDGNVTTTRTPAIYDLIVSTSADPAAPGLPLYQTPASGRLSLKPGVAKAVPVRLTIPPGAVAPGNYFLHIRITAELNVTNGQTIVVMPFSVV